MILKETLRNIVKSQKENLSQFEEGIEREKIKEIDLDMSFAVIVSGIRRSGKSTLLRQLMKKTENFYYFNFEDPRAVGFDVSDFQRLDEVFHEEYGDSKQYFFDEIQNAEKWELFVRTLLDRKNHVFITGSNASLLSKELGTRLTGRHLTYELFPFSFTEFLKIRSLKPSVKSFEEYFLKIGGFPEYIKTGKAEILQELLNDIIMRDIAVRYGLKNTEILRKMASYLLTNTGKEFSYNSLKKIFELGSTNTVISFISYFEDSYLLFSVPKFEYSLKKQIVNPKKIYSIDNAMSIVNSISFSEDNGRMLENIVFIELKKRYKDIFFFRENGECDFVVRDDTKIRKAFQVCYNLNEENKNREINGLLEAMEEFNLKQGIILTYNQGDELIIKGKKISLIPVWKWMLKKNSL
ncbi:MAG: ATP-binding protein [Candidatus Aenigmarchaeota archaeon]|nr:ATP-binding protein [Candidatus Aenigmarchaeota archaeon]